MAQKREEFGSSIAAILALAGSAIGLGNIWRFPYMVGQHGGGAFILIYILFTILFSLPVFLSEALVGRNTGSNPKGAMDKLAPGTKWKWFAICSVLGPLIVISYYSVVGGWSVAYLFKSCVSSFGAMSREEVSRVFSDFTSSGWWPILAHTIFLLLNMIVIRLGVRNGIEKLSKITMPLLFLIMILLMVVSISLPGSWEGVEYLIKPDFSKIDGPAIAGAMGQSFFSLSLGIGTILTYSSYMKKTDNLVKSSVLTAVFDLLFALVAGFVIMPAVFSVGIEPSAGPGLVFEAFPFIFANVDAITPVLGKIVTISFFFAILMAALTSEVSMFEVCTAYLVEEKKMNRNHASLIVFVLGWSIGAACSVFPRFFDICDFTASNIFMTLGSLALTIFVGWRMKKATVRDELTNGGSIKTNSRLFKVIYILIRYVAPVGILAVFISNFIS